MRNILSNLLENGRQRALVLSTNVLSTGTKYNCTVVQRTSTFSISTLYLSTSTKYNCPVHSTCTFTSKNVLVPEISTYWVRKVLSIVLSIQCLFVLSSKMRRYAAKEFVWLRNDLGRPYETLRSFHTKLWVTKIDCHWLGTLFQVFHSGLYRT